MPNTNAKPGSWSRDIAMMLGTYIPGFSKPPARFVTEEGKAVHGVVAEFETPSGAYHAAEKIRDAGYKRWDVYSPFPIHGIEEAMGIKRTKLPLFVAAVGFTGAGLGLLLQYWVTASDFPLVVQGKPYGAWEPFVPIMFEMGILPAAFAAIFGMLALNGLPRFHHPLLARESFWRVSDDRFYICIEAEDPKFDAAQVKTLLESAGSSNVDLVEDDA
jgi:ActD protein